MGTNSIYKRPPASECVRTNRLVFRRVLCGCRVMIGTDFVLSPRLFSQTIHRPTASSDPTVGRTHRQRTNSRTCHVGQRHSKAFAFEVLIICQCESLISIFVYTSVDLCHSPVMDVGMSRIYYVKRKSN